MSTEDEIRGNTETEGERPPGQLTAESNDSPTAPEVLEVLRREREASIDINVLLVHIVDRSTDSDDAVKNAERLLDLTEKYEKTQLELFRQRVNAVIDAKQRDPDEILKRKENSTRRFLKYSLAALAGVGLVGGISCALAGVPIVVTGIVLFTGTLGVAMLAPLASGESMSPTDVIRILKALPTPGGEDRDRDETTGKRRDSDGPATTDGGRDEHP